MQQGTLGQVRSTEGGDCLPSYEDWAWVLLELRVELTTAFMNAQRRQDVRGQDRLLFALKEVIDARLRELGPGLDPDSKIADASNT